MHNLFFYTFCLFFYFFRLYWNHIPNQPKVFSVMLIRTLSKHLEHITNNFPIVLITGPRQVGKSVLLENFKPEKYHRVSLDDLEERELAINDPALFLQNHQPPVFIDEVQYAPHLFSYIKIYVDQHKEQNGLFLLTGSQKFNLMRGIKETLAGRVAVLDLLGFSQNEINKTPDAAAFLPTTEWIENQKAKISTPKTNQDIYHDIWMGSFPKLLNNKGEDRDIYYNSYIQTYIERDVQSIYQISDSIAFKNFIKAVAARTGQLLNVSDLAKDISIDSKTAKTWLGMLETSGLIYLLHPYYTNVTNRIVKTPKLYFLDTGLCAYLTGWDSPKSLEAGAMSGAVLETYVFAEILKSYWHNAKEAPIYFYRDKDKKEIDFIIEKNNTLYPIEVKKTMMPLTNAGKNFSVLKNINKSVSKGVVLCMKPEISYISQEIVSVPIWKI